MIAICWALVLLTINVSLAVVKSTADRAWAMRRHPSNQADA